MLTEIVASLAVGAAPPPPVPDTVLASATLRPAACPFEMGARVSCARLDAPEDWSKPDGRRVSLLVATVRTRAAEPKADPIVFLNGGPGQSALAAMEFLLAAPDTGRDMVVLEQRGVGYSEPSLACLYSEDRRGCYDRLTAEGIDLSQYNTVAISDDVAALARAVGRRPWNVLGVSYGGYLAAKYSVRYPSDIRALVLDSPLSPAFGARDTLSGLLDAIDRVTTSCAADAACARRFPDLKVRLVAALQAVPRAGLHLADGTYVSRTSMLGAIAGVMHDSSTLPFAPLMIDAVARGDASAAQHLGERLETTLMAKGFDRNRFFANSLHWSVGCADRFYRDEDKPTPPKSDWPADIVGSGDAPIMTRESCSEDWPVAFAGDWLREPVETDMPALFLAGPYDYVTPPAATRDMARTFRRSTVLVAPQAGHTALTSGSACVAERVAAFLGDPAAPVSPCPTDVDVAWRAEMP